MSNVSLFGKPLACLEDCLDESFIPSSCGSAWHSAVQIRTSQSSLPNRYLSVQYATRRVPRGISISPEWNHNDRPTENLLKKKGWQIEINNLVASALNSSFIKHVVRSAGSRKTFRQ